MNAQQLLSQIRSVRELASRDLDGHDPRSRPAMESAKAAAKQELKALEIEYGQYLSKAAAGIVLVGSGDQAGFAELASKEGDAIALDAGALYARFAAAIEPTMTDRREFDILQMRVFNTELEAVCKDFRVVSIDAPKFQAGHVCPTTADIARVVESMLHTTVGVDLNRLAVRQQLFDKALAAGADKDIIPVVVTNISEAEAEELPPTLFTSSITVKTPERADKDVVLKVFGQLKKRISKKQ